MTEPRIIKILPRLKIDSEALSSFALIVLRTGVDLGNDEILDRAIEIAARENWNVKFQLTNGNWVDPDLAWRMRTEQGWDLRFSTESGRS